MRISPRHATLALLTSACTVLAGAPVSAGPPTTPATTVTTGRATFAADTRPPTAPSYLRSSRLTCQSVTLTWAASRDDVGVAFYDVYHDGQLMKSVAGTTLSDRPDRRRRASPGACTSTPATPPATCRRPARRSPITPPQCQADTQRARPPRPASTGIGVRHHRHPDAGPRRPTTSGSARTTSAATA